LARRIGVQTGLMLLYEDDLVSVIKRADRISRVPYDENIT